jgi:amino acid transporter
MGWDYAIGWLVVLPFEITAAGITIQFWRDDINIGVWIAVFLTILAAVQIFGVRGYGEVEFVLSIIKVVAIIGFILFAIIDDCGGVKSDPRGYIGAAYWHDPGAFRNGFQGFCSVFVTAAFAFGGTELVGLAAAEAADPRKTLPKATKQVFWRITTFYVLSLFLVGLIVPSNDPNLLNSSGANTKYSPFVIAINLAGVKGLPSVFNAVITISVISVANSCTFASTRTMQALAQNGMGPKFLAYIDKRGRPIWCVIIQIAFGLLAFINEANVGATVFDWLLALSGLSYFFVWGSICLSHIRFRRGWKVQGHSVSELPYQAQFGVIGSYIGLSLNIIALIATFYTSLYVSLL